jgi:hypothetical protein
MYECSEQALQQYWSKTTFLKYPFMTKTRGAITATKTAGPIFLLTDTDFEWYVSDILWPFLEGITEEEIAYGYFTNNRATLHTANHSIILNRVFLGTDKSCKLWPARSLIFSL